MKGKLTAALALASLLYGSARAETMATGFGNHGHQYWFTDEQCEFQGHLFENQPWATSGTGRNWKLYLSDSEENIIDTGCWAFDFIKERIAYAFEKDTALEGLHFNFEEMEWTQAGTNLAKHWNK